MNDVEDPAASVRVTVSPEQEDLSRDTGVAIGKFYFLMASFFFF